MKSTPLRMGVGGVDIGAFFQEIGCHLLGLVLASGKKGGIACFVSGVYIKRVIFYEVLDALKVVFQDACKPAFFLLFGEGFWRDILKRRGYGREVAHTCIGVVYLLKADVGNKRRAKGRWSGDAIEVYAWDGVSIIRIDVRRRRGGRVLWLG